MSEQVKFIFDGESRILDVIKNGGNIVEFLGFPSEKCALIGSEIKLLTGLGNGATGVVYAIKAPGIEERLYAVKVTNLGFDFVFNTRKKLLKQMKNDGYTWDQLKKIQPPKYIKKFENADAHDYVDLIFPPIRCLQYDDSYFLNFLTGKYDVKVEAGSYLCDASPISEYCINAYVGTLYREGKCAHFFNVYSAFACTKDNNIVPDLKMYTFMDRIDGELERYKSCIKVDKFLSIKGHDQDMITSIYIQTIFAIAAYQDQFQISHNDLHLGNVFVQLVTPNTIFGGKSVIDADWYHYSFKGKNFYIPAVPIIVKIGDFGLSVKYKPPIVGDSYAFSKGYDNGDGPRISNAYMPSYDNLLFSASYSKILPQGKFFDLCVRYMCPKIPEHYSISDGLISRKYVRELDYRPVLKNLKNVKTSADIINGPIMERYGKIPKGDIITLGEI